HLKSGFPPKTVEGQDEDNLVDIGIQSGTAVTVLEHKNAENIDPSAASPPSPSAALAPAAHPTPPSTIGTGRSHPSVTASSPVPRTARTPPAAMSSSVELIQILKDMGFDAGTARMALEVASGDINTALELCMGGGVTGNGSTSGCE
ncbi:unnamed protein product, partial [Discosporangium mesarthrocarpum]